jgi:hypothetical protein
MSKEEAILELEQQLAESRREIERLEDRDREDKDSAAALIAAVTPVKLPDFWVKDPVLWFRQCESAFRRSSISSSGVKFDHVVMKLPHDVSLSCRSLLLSIKFEDKDAYERLRDHLCRCFGQTKWQLAFSLLDAPQLGDRRPTQLLQDLRALLPAEEPEGTLFQAIFLKRLPTAICDHILAADVDNIDAMAALADRLHDRPAVSANIATLTPEQEVCALGQRQSSGRSPDRSRSTANRSRGGGFADRGNNRGGRNGRRGQTRQQTPARQPSSSGWCFIHEKYGAAAVSCRPGCTYAEN